MALQAKALFKDDVLQTRKACIQCREAFIADLLVLQARAAGTQCTRWPKAFNSGQLAMCTFYVLQARVAGTQCTR